ncbi:MAG: hypothetical protein AB1420_15795 [Bacillota bacterium]
MFSKQSHGDGKKENGEKGGKMADEEKTEEEKSFEEVLKSSGIKINAENIIKSVFAGDIYDLKRIYKILTRVGIKPHLRTAVITTWADMNDLVIPKHLSKLIDRMGKEEDDEEEEEETSEEAKEDKLSSVERKKKMLDEMSKKEEEALLDEQIATKIEELKAKRLAAIAKSQELEKRIKGELPLSYPMQSYGMPAIYRRALRDDKGELIKDANGNPIIEEYTYNPNDPSAFYEKVIVPLVKILKPEDKGGSGGKSEYIQYLELQLKKAETELEKARLEYKETRDEIRSMEQERWNDKFEKLQSQIRTPAEQIAEIRQNIELGKSLGMVGTTDSVDKEIALEKLRAENNRWQQQFEYQKQSDTRDFYKSIVSEVVKPIVEKVPPILEKMQAVRHGGPYQPPAQQTQSGINYYQDAQGNIYDEKGNLLFSPPSQEPPKEPTGEYTKEDIEKIEEWRRSHVEGTEESNSVGNSKEGNSKSSETIHSGRPKAGSRKK